MKRLTVCVLLAFLCGCEGEVPEPAPPEIPTDPNPVSRSEDVQLEGKQLKSGPFEHRVEDMTFQVPEGWHQIEPTPTQERMGFYRGRFSVPAAGTESELTISLVPGGIPANIERWRGLYPVGDPQETDLSLQGRTVKLVDYSGEGPPSLKNRILGAAIPMDDGRDCYVKLTGQPTAVRQVREEFRKFIESVQFE